MGADVATACQSALAHAMRAFQRNPAAHPGRLANLTEFSRELRRPVSTLRTRVLKSCAGWEAAAAPTAPTEGHEDDQYRADVPDARLPGQPGPVHPGREPLSAAHGRAGARARPQSRPRQRPRRGAAARPVAPAPRRGGQPQVPGLRPAAGGPHPGRQHRAHEGRAPVRPGARRAPRVVRPPLDPGRDPRIRAAQLAPREGRDDQGAAQALLQSAPHEGALGRAVDQGSASRSRRISASSPRRSSRWRRA